MLRLFISSVQKELAGERRGLKDYLAKCIERRGTGTRDMIRRCRKTGLREPHYPVCESFVQTLWRPVPAATGQATPQVTTQAAPQDKELWSRVFQELIARAGQATGQAGPSLLAYFGEPKTSREIQDALGLRHRETFLDNYLTPMLENGLLDRTIPDKPTSPNQKYRLTAKGRAWLERATGKLE